MSIFQIIQQSNLEFWETATRGSLQQKLFLKFSQYSQENNFAGASF